MNNTNQTKNKYKKYVRVIGSVATGTLLTYAVTSLTPAVASKTTEYAVKSIMQDFLPNLPLGMTNYIAGVVATEISNQVYNQIKDISYFQSNFTNMKNYFQKGYELGCQAVNVAYKMSDGKSLSEAITKAYDKIKKSKPWTQKIDQLTDIEKGRA